MGFGGDDRGNERGWEGRGWEGRGRVGQGGEGLLNYLIFQKTWAEPGNPS